MTTAAVATKGQSLRSLIAGDTFKKELNLALPSMLPTDRFVRVALTTINKNPKLANCTQPSLFACMLDCAALGIEPDGRRAHLIPYGDQCTLIIDYKGLIELARRSGEVLDWQGVLVCDNDDFEASATEVIKHRVNWREKRGAVYAVYSVVTFKDGLKGYDIMNVDEVNAIRDRSKSGRNGPWVTDWNEMAKKTVIRRHSKVLPLSAEFRDALDKDQDWPRDITENITVSPSVVQVPVVGAAIDEAHASNLYDKSMEGMETAEEVQEAMTAVAAKRAEKAEPAPPEEKAPEEVLPKPSATARLIAEITALEEGSDAATIKATRDQLGILPSADLKEQDDDLLSLLKAAYSSAKAPKGDMFNE